LKARLRRERLLKAETIRKKRQWDYTLSSCRGHLSHSQSTRTRGPGCIEFCLLANMRRGAMYLKTLKSGFLTFHMTMNLSQHRNNVVGLLKPTLIVTLQRALEQWWEQVAHRWKTASASTTTLLNSRCTPNVSPCTQLMRTCSSCRKKAHF
jgi:hypothetical protein